MIGAVLASLQRCWFPFLASQTNWCLGVQEGALDGGLDAEQSFVALDGLKVSPYPAEVEKSLSVGSGWKLKVGWPILILCIPGHT